MSDFTRRQFLAGCVSGAMAAAWRGDKARADSSHDADFATRGVVLVQVRWPRTGGHGVSNFPVDCVLADQKPDKGISS